MRLALIGIAIGLAGAIGLTNLLKALDSQAALGTTDRLLFGVSAQDPLTLIGVPLLLLAVASLASWVPARRATLVDPVEALREE